MPPTSSPFDATALAAVRSELQAGTDSPSGLTDAERVDALRALEELVCTATAAQAALAAELAESVEADHEALGVPAARRGQGVGAMVGHARRESPHRGRRHLGLARIVANELPHTWAAWRDGRITEWTATLIARETSCLSLEHRLAVDAHVAADADVLEAMSPRQVIGACQGESSRLDAAAVVARRRKAEAERRVSIRPAPDTMVWMSALLPVKDGVAVHAVLTRAADTARAGGDLRGRGQVMADELVRRITDTSDEAALTDEAASTDSPTTCSTTTGAGRDRPTRTVALNLTMSDQSLFGTSEDPAHLDGYGPIPAEVARELVAGALTGDESVWLRRLYTSPTTGELLTMEAKSRLFPASLARFIRLRDRICRTPWCDAPVRHLDHIRPHGVAGPTTADNGQALCEACNHDKQAPRWRARPGPDGQAVTTTPTGHSITTRPPPIVTIRQRALPPLHVDYVLIG